jgi:hypothetical protein
MDSRKDRIIEKITFDNNSIKGHIAASGEIRTIMMMKPCFTQGPHTARIADTVVRQMIWNLINSLEELNSITTVEFKSIETIVELSKATNDVPTRTISHHIVGGFDCLRTHLKY